MNKKRRSSLSGENHWKRSRTWAIWPIATLCSRIELRRLRAVHRNRKGIRAEIESRAIQWIGEQSVRWWTDELAFRRGCRRFGRGNIRLVFEREMHLIGTLRMCDGMGMIRCANIVETTIVAIDDQITLVDMGTRTALFDGSSRGCRRRCRCWQIEKTSDRIGDLPRWHAVPV